MKRRGFTLIELLIASTIALLIFSAAMGAGISLQKLNTDQQDLMEIQTSLRFSENILIQELEKTGTGFARVAINGFNQKDANLNRPRVTLTIEDANNLAACTSGNCSLMTIYSGDIQNSLQIREAIGTTLSVKGSATTIDHWNPANRQIQAFILVNQKSGQQCLFEDVAADQYELVSGSPNELNVSKLTNITGMTACDLDDFNNSRSFIAPLRETLFMTNGFKINDPPAFIPLEEAQPRLQYIPNSRDATFLNNGNLEWLPLSREMESLAIRYTIFNNADPTQADRRRITVNGSLDDRTNIQTFEPTEIKTASDIQNIIDDNNLQPMPDATGIDLMNYFDDAALEKFTIPLLRRISQIEMDIIVRKKCKDADQRNCTDAIRDLDDNGYQVRTVTTRINPNNLALIALNEFIR